jgi:hypothetical protein
LRAARLVPSQPRAWWALRDALVAAKKPRAALTALRALHASTEDPLTRKSVCADAVDLCGKVAGHHPFCLDIA